MYQYQTKLKKYPLLPLGQTFTPPPHKLPDSLLELPWAWSRFVFMIYPFPNKSWISNYWWIWIFFWTLITWFVMGFSVFWYLWWVLICSYWYGFCWFVMDFAIFLVFSWFLIGFLSGRFKPLKNILGFGMFTSSTHSSGDLCGGEFRCVVWWRFGQAKHRSRRLRVVGCKLFFFFLLNSFTIWLGI